MPDDPREVLKAAGVECVEVDEWCGPWTYSEEVDISAASEKGDAAILALARLVAAQAKHMKQSEVFVALLKGMVEQHESGEFEGRYDLDDLLNRIDEAHDA